MDIEQIFKQAGIVVQVIADCGFTCPVCHPQQAQAA